jgi:hypothetical protein
MKTRKMFNDLTKDQKKQIIVNLEETANMAEFLNELNVYFDLVNCQPKSLTKALISSQIINLVMPMINPAIKE